MKRSGFSEEQIIGILKEQSSTRNRIVIGVEGARPGSPTTSPRGAVSARLKSAPIESA